MHFNESTIPWAVGYLWTGDPAYLNATCRWYEIIERGDDGMQPHGVPVCDENTGPTGSFARDRKRATSPAYMWSQITLLRVSGQGLMGDRVERAFFNAAPAAVSRDFKTHVYHQTPNRVNATMLGGGRFNYNKTHRPLVLHRGAEPLPAELPGPHVDGHLRQRLGRRRFTAPARSPRSWPIACRSNWHARPTIRSTMSSTSP